MSRSVLPFTSTYEIHLEPGSGQTFITSFLLDHPLVLGVWRKHVESWIGTKMLLRLAFGRSSQSRVLGYDNDSSKEALWGSEGKQRAPGKGVLWQKSMAALSLKNQCFRWTFGKIGLR